MYVTRIIFASDEIDFKAFESLPAAQDHLRSEWAGQYDFDVGRFFRGIRSIAIFDVDGSSDPEIAIELVEEGNGARVRLVYIKDAPWIEQMRWELTGAKPREIAF